MLALLDTGFSNLKAYCNVLEYIGEKYEIISCGKDLSLNYHSSILLPGVSNFGALASELDKRKFRTKIIEFASNDSKIIGTCSGMQILFKSSEENLPAVGLGLINGRVLKFPKVNEITLNIGWKKVNLSKYFFVHGYYCVADEKLAREEYTEFNGVSFLSDFQHKNIFGFQYHPEKSGSDGVDRLAAAIRSN